MQIRRTTAPDFAVSLATTEDDLAAAKRLRYSVFVEELGGRGPLVDHATRREQDRFDPFFDHLVLRDLARPRDDQIVGLYRLLRDDKAGMAGGFYTEAEFDLTPLRTGGRRMMELGRSCLHRDYRGGAAMHHLWGGIASYVERHDIEILLGVASLPGTAIADLAPALALLRHRHLAPPHLRPTAKPPGVIPLDTVDAASIDRAGAMRTIPALIKAYLRMGSFVGEGAFVDRDFNTTDVCMICDTRRLTTRQRARYTRATG